VHNHDISLISMHGQGVYGGHIWLLERQLPQHLSAKMSKIEGSTDFRQVSNNVLRLAIQLAVSQTANEQAFSWILNQIRICKTQFPQARTRVVFLTDGQPSTSESEDQQRSMQGRSTLV